MNAFKLLLLICGLNLSFLYWGILQERITTSEFDMSFDIDGSETLIPYRFKNIFFLNALQCLVCATVALSILLAKYLFGLLTKRKGTSFSRELFNVRKARPRNYPSLKTFVKLGFSYAMGPSIGLLSLRFISYPLYLLIKTSKLIPNMCIGYFCYGHRYERKRIFAALMITVGLVLFTVSETRKGACEVNIVDFLSTLDIKQWGQRVIDSLREDPLGVTADCLRSLHEKLIVDEGNRKTLVGTSLVLANLFIDAFTSSTQDELVMRYEFNSYQLMFLTNFFAHLVLLVVCVGSEVSFAMQNVSLADMTTGVALMSHAIQQESLRVLERWRHESFSVFMSSTAPYLSFGDLIEIFRQNISASRVVPIIQSLEASACWVPPQLYTSVFALLASMELRRTVLAYLLCGVSGQLFLFVIQNIAGSLFLVSVTMIRKVLSIVISLINAHVAVSVQTGPVADSKKMLAVSLIIIGISMEFFSTVRRKTKKA
ncbi:hypothetical protein XU18_5218 [Perkinsela sp. CCAP 1560/4]|nr:hypothetical protein XU18_5218 [Perkinsela sp. CCAP 1560/4]|eukprot:KNH00541.1 hypothetical protein XU18_5218 [Perkinsela sp. CCAP 1560/4]